MGNQQQKQPDEEKSSQPKLPSLEELKRRTAQRRNPPAKRIDRYIVIVNPTEE